MLFYLSMIETKEDKGKFVLIYEKYRKLMFYIANQILKDPYLAEDAVHQTFIKIIENLDKIEAVDCHKTKSYVVTMVKNCAINYYNRRRSHIEIPFEELENIITDDIDYQEDLDYLTKAITKLPVIYKAILTLKYVQEYSNAEIAKMLDISEATVRKRLERAKFKVQEILEKEEHADAL